MYHYTSGVSEFMQKFLDANTAVASEQRRHRQKLWDVKLNKEEETEFKLGAVAKKPYTYFPNPEPAQTSDTDSADDC